MVSHPRIGVMLPRDLPSSSLLRSHARPSGSGSTSSGWSRDLGFRGEFHAGGGGIAVTERIRVGIGILPAAVRNAAYAAMEIATLSSCIPDVRTWGSVTACRAG